ncbi:hypothetical protein D9V37_07035 [Nocardioides mangrovicus]|uniref:Uncharacterized protein n=1 Tax=Nocardioides mangrovicus TaxID=2478913 RepID=A0A3L8P2M4_9ACTN|nr:hypothetical protein [Nocardioides mangrovicus]RLV49666.1 hypothetical protein D9V37_07035 [Nocardioides mangrovicus]
MVDSQGRHWHVTVTVAGEQVEPLLMRSALIRFSEQRPFLESMRFTGTGAEITFWDQADSMLDVASLALRVWNEHRDSAGLPRWEVVGLEVVERDLHHNRTEGHQVLVGGQDVRPSF